MGYRLKLFAVASVFLVLPVEAVITNRLSVANSSVVNEEVKITQGEGREKRRDEALRLNELGLQQFNKGEFREGTKTTHCSTRQAAN